MTDEAMACSSQPSAWVGVADADAGGQQHADEGRAQADDSV